MSRYCFSLLALLSSVLAATKFESPNPRFDCSNMDFKISYLACNAHDYTQCCPLENACCAGGCCSADSVCVNVGTSKEGCCPILGGDYCGANPLSLKIPVKCVTSDEGSYQCPYGSECTPDGGCAGGSGTDNAPLAKTATVATSKTTGIPVASRADPPEATAASSAGSKVLGSGGSSAAATNANAALISIAGFSFVASVVLAVVLV